MIRTYNLRFYTSVLDANDLTATKLMNRQPCCLANKINPGVYGIYNAWALVEPLLSSGTTALLFTM